MEPVDPSRVRDCMVSATHPAAGQQGQGEYRRCRREAVQTIQHTPMARQNNATVLNPTMALNHTFEQIPQYRHQAGGQNNGEITQVVATYNQPEHQAEQQVGRHTTQKALPGFTWAHRRFELVFTPAATRKISTDISASDNSNNQQ